MEQTYVMVKPDGVQRGLVGEVISRIEKRGLKIVALRMNVIAEATAKGITMIADAMAAPGGAEAAKLKVAEQFINEFGKMAEKSNTMIVPADMANVGGMVASATEILNNVKLQK